MKYLHITLTENRYESRIKKEITTLRKYFNETKIYVVAVARGQDDGVSISDMREIVIRLNLGANLKFWKLFSHIIKYFKLSIFCFNLVKYKNIKNIHIHSVELLPMAAAFKLIFNVFIVYDAHELENERISIGPIKRCFYSVIQHLWIGYADVVYVVSKPIYEYYKNKYKVKNLFLLENRSYSLEYQKSNYFRELFNIQENEIIYLYFGFLTGGRGLEIIIDVFSREVKSSVLVIVGYGPYKQMVQCATQRYSNIHFHDALDYDKIIPYASSADVGLCLIENLSLSYNYSLPNKLFEYCSAGLPVVGTRLPMLSKCINEYKIGYLIDETSPNSLADLVKWIEKNSADIKIKSSNALKFSKNNSWQSQENLILDSLRGLK